jgi:hypothetical protein
MTGGASWARAASCPPWLPAGAAEAVGATGIIVPADPRLLDLLRNGDEEEDRSDLGLSQG